jgi:LysM repeat protein
MGNILRYPRLTNVLVVGTLLLSLMLVPNAMAQGNDPSISLSPTSGPAGTNVTVTGTGFPVNVAVVVGPGVQGGEQIFSKTVTTNANGDFSATVSMPTDANPNQSWEIQALVPGGGGGKYTATKSFDVTRSQSSEQTYTVKSGDTLSEIAAMFNTSVSALLRANPQIENASVITPGQVLVIPGSLVVIPDTGQQVYVVKSGDTLSEIAVNFGTTVDALLKANPDITNRSLIFPGERITIPTTANVIPNTGQMIYVVQSGDTLSEIAVRFGTTVNAILNANPDITNPSLITPGERIVLPSSVSVIPSTGQEVYVVQSGDTLSEIAVRFGTTVNAILNANPDITNPSLITPGEQIVLPTSANVIPNTGQVIYVVQPGDTLSEIAVRFGTTVNALLDANPSITDPNLIYPNQRLVIPQSNNS